MQCSQTIEHIHSFEIHDSEVTYYYIEIEEEIKFQVTGFNFTVPLFKCLLQCIRNMNGQKTSPYILVYQYYSLHINGLIAHPMLFIRGRPKVHFLYENEQYLDCLIIELHLTLLNDKLTLLPIHLDAENDS